VTGVKPTAGTLLYCRPGFERECAQEITAAGAAIKLSGQVQSVENSGYVVFLPRHDAHDGAARLRQQLKFSDVVFPRQIIHEAVLCDTLPAGDRITPLVDIIKQNFDGRFAECWLETADTNEAKELSGFLKRFSPAFNSAASKTGIVNARRGSGRLHVFFLGSGAAWIGVTDHANSAPWPMGIPRLKMPRDAPSRSTLKLAEALMIFLDEPQRAELLREGRTAVDLGAAPGGWTWQLVHHGLHVTAIDNGSLDPALLASHQVEHLRVDGFHWKPKRPVDWVVCDMIEQPGRIAALIGDWLAEGHARYAIFNLKLPMKKRREQVLAAYAAITQRLGGRPFQWRCRQLYHDREEVTVFVALDPHHH